MVFGGLSDTIFSKGVHMNLVFKDFERWYNELGEELQRKFKNDYQYLVDVITDWQEGFNSYCRKSKIEEANVNLNLYVLRQALVDAFDDLRRLTEYHDTSCPNPIKTMSYYCYWIIRRKPLTVCNEKILENSKLSDSKKLKMLFCNEHVCVQLLVDAMFPGLNTTCENKAIHSYADKQLKKFKSYMLYYLTYRVESPKSLEAILVSGTMHPIWDVEKVIWEDVHGVFEEEI